MGLRCSWSKSVPDPVLGTTVATEPNDPLWYKDAVIYQVHVRSFFDRNDDGVGDFPGLTEKLDYVERLGVNTIWLLPFYPSPMRDDGYDIADYRGINPVYGTHKDFKAFIEAAHERGLKVITELVVNHTSDQHPWFQAARKAPPGSAKRNFYVWSDTDERFPETRIIFTDTEDSNWAWDSGREAILLAPLLLASTGFESQQSAGRASRDTRDALLARHGRRWVAARCDPISLRARWHEQRESSRDARGHSADPGGHRRALREPHAACGSEPVAGGRARVLRERRSSATWRTTFR